MYIIYTQQLNRSFCPGWWLPFLSLGKYFMSGVWHWQSALSLNLHFFPWWRHQMEIFRVTDPLWGEFTGHRWILLTKASDWDIWCFLCSAPVCIILPKMANMEQSQSLFTHEAPSFNIKTASGRWPQPYCDCTGCLNIDRTPVLSETLLWTTKYRN